MASHRPMTSPTVIIGEALELLNEGLTPYLRTSCKLYGISWPHQQASSPPDAQMGWDPQVLLSSLDTVVQNWESVFQNMLQPSFLNIIPEICAALDRWLNQEPIDQQQAAQILRSIAHVLASLSLRAAADEVSALQVRLGGEGRPNLSFNEIDANGDGVIDRSEFNNAIESAHGLPITSPELELVPCDNQKKPLSSFYLEEVSERYYANEYFDVRERFGRFLPDAASRIEEGPEGLRIFRVLNDEIEHCFEQFTVDHPECSKNHQLFFYANHDDVLNSRMQHGFPGPKDVTIRAQRVSFFSSTVEAPHRDGETCRFVLSQVATGRVHNTSATSDIATTDGCRMYYDSLCLRHDKGDKRSVFEIVPLYQDQCLARYLVEFKLKDCKQPTHRSPKPKHNLPRSPSPQPSARGSSRRSPTPSLSPSLSPQLHAGSPTRHLNFSLQRWDSDDERVLQTLWSYFGEIMKACTSLSVQQVANQVLHDRFSLRKAELNLPNEQPKFMVYSDAAANEFECLEQFMSRGFWLPRASKASKGRDGLLENSIMVLPSCPKEAMYELKRQRRATVLICEAAPGKAWQATMEQAKRIKVSKILQQYDSIQLIKSQQPGNNREPTSCFLHPDQLLPRFVVDFELQAR